MAFKDIRKSRKWMSAEEIRIIVALLLLLSALLALNLYLARTLPAGEWLYLRWSGARAFLFDGVLPYTREIAQEVQQIVYGREAFATEYRYVLNDPLYIVLLYTPLALIPDFMVARGIWMLAAEMALFTSVMFSIRLSEWQPPRGLNVILIGFGLFSFFSLNAIVTASPVIFLNFLYLGVLLALRSFSDELAGGLLFLSAYQWEVGGLFFLFVLLFVIGNRRWGVLAGFGMALIVSLIATFLIRSDWGLPYIRAVISNGIQGARLNLDVILSSWFPGSRFSLGGIVSLLLIVVVFIESLGAVDAPFRRVAWTASLALAAMPLIGLGMFPSNYAVLLLPLVLVVSLVWERWLRRRLIAVILLLFAAIFIPYWLYLETVVAYAPLYSELLSVLPPVFMIVALYWMRWWVVHSPRIWADQIGNRR
jgi:hypothetical protein